MNSSDTGFDLKYYFHLLRRRAWIIVLIAVIAAATAYVVSRSLTPVYESSTTLLVEAGRNYAPEQIGDIRVGESLATTYSVIMRSNLIVGEALQQVEFQPEELRVLASPIQGTQLIQLRVEAADPQQAAVLANTIANVFIEYIYNFQSAGFQTSKDNLTAQLAILDEQLNETGRAIEALGESPETAEERAQLETIAAQYRQSYTAVVRALEEARLAEIAGAANITQLDAATVRPRPIRPNTLVNTALAAISGLAIAVTLVLAQDLLDDSLKGVTDIKERLGLPVIGFFAHFDATKSALIYRDEPRSPAAESLRSSRVNLKYVTVDRPLRTLLITSPMPSEGKSVFSANFALACVGSGQNAILVDCDLRRPNVHNLFKASNQEGLSSFFIDLENNDVSSYTRLAPDTKLNIITSGPLPPNPSELLDTERAASVIRSLTEKYDLAILDGPPITGLADAVTLAKRVDGVMLVLRIGRTKMSIARDAINRLNQVGANVVGILLVDADGKATRDISPYGYYYTSYARYADATSS